uniref:CHK kinase-like domain-containing protein n=1 Tax=Plectus sambesii TaxID=2011161 RepID=A0A914WAN8_9BILA
MGCGSSKPSADSPSLIAKQKRSTVSVGDHVQTVNGNGIYHGLSDDSIACDNEVRRAMDGSNRLCDTDITLEWLVQTLEVALNETASTPSYIAERIGKGYGFMSDVLRVTFSWESETFPSTVVLKITSIAKAVERAAELAGVEELSEDDRISTERLIAANHRRECVTYEWLAKQDINIPIPLIYFTRPHTENEVGVVVMEDFHDRGDHPDYVQGLTLKQLERILTALAAVHAKSLQNDDWQSLLATMTKARFETAAERFDQTKEYLNAQLPDGFKGINRAKRFFATDFLYDTVIESCSQLELPLVLVHGEIWAGNFIFDEKDQNTLLAVIDWQDAHPGCIAEDITELLVMNATAEMRRTNAEALLDFYHAKLEEYYGEGCPISVWKVKQAYQKLLPVAMVSFLLLLPTVSVNEALVGAPKDRSVKQKMLFDRGQAILEDTLSTLPPDDPIPASESTFVPAQTFEQPVTLTTPSADDEGKSIVLAKSDF